MMGLDVLSTRSPCGLPSGAAGIPSRWDACGGRPRKSFLSLPCLAGPVQFSPVRSNLAFWPANNAALLCAAVLIALPLLTVAN
ncbi:hypothetical protein LY76DRAFT_586417 [Colletotrichum caudatum]|nr:hypothetical protein LY76DRAFT_586417 [Colletotrichum caudatum]